jgi:hypothetical protein
MNEDRLTPEEEMAFRNLPREAEPSRILEERIVRSLRKEGILTPKVEPGFAGEPGRHRIRWLRPWMLAGSLAASLALFATGMVLGQWMGSQSTTQAFIQVREQDAAQVALRIQEAGSAYVSALAALGDLRAAGAGEGTETDELSRARSELQLGKEVALGALYAAAYELARVNPEDADVLRVLQILDERRAREEGGGAAPGRPERCLVLRTQARSGLAWTRLEKERER